MLVTEIKINGINIAFIRIHNEAIKTPDGIMYEFEAYDPEEKKGEKLITGKITHNPEDGAMELLCKTMIQIVKFRHKSDEPLDKPF